MIRYYKDNFWVNIKHPETGELYGITGWFGCKRTIYQDAPDEIDIEIRDLSITSIEGYPTDEHGDVDFGILEEEDLIKDEIYVKYIS